MTFSSAEMLELSLADEAVRGGLPFSLADEAVHRAFLAFGRSNDRLFHYP